MDDRYQIIGKIAQGGLGLVYKAHDVRMIRDVAIKRILDSPDDASISGEATRQLIKEASALASLQHPNIVTIYDVGNDDEGPFVVMELLTGHTLEEIISGGSFTWDDFRQLAMQSLEALIAAQELHIVHRDIKPGNIMLTWLPSGKFQVKVVDFGLAKLSTKPSLQTIDQSDGVFGSIYFMGPEQFERIPIDQRVDLYALGCVFYYALTGSYAFDGENAVEVMASHLQHHVTPLEEVREGIPLWGCNWIMWLINRQPSDRPESAREALQVFMQNDAAYYAPELSTGAPTPVAPVEIPKRPKLFIPGAAQTPEIVEEPKPAQSPKKTASISKPLSPPQGSKPSVHQSTQAYQIAAAPEPESEPVALEPEPIAPESEPEPIAPEPESEPEPEILAPLPVEPEPIATPQIKAPILLRSTATQTAIPHPTAQAATTPTEKQVPTLVRAAPTSAALKPALLSPTGNLSKPTIGTQSVTPTRGETTASNQPTAPKKRMSNSKKILLATVLTIVTVFLSFFLFNKIRENAEIALFNKIVKAAAEDGATEVLVNKQELEVLLQNAATTSAIEERAAIYMALYLAKATDKTDIDARIAEFATTELMHSEIRTVIIRDVLGKRRNPSVITTLINFAKIGSNEPSVAIAAIEACRFMAADRHFDSFLEILKNTTNESIRKAAEENLAEIIQKSASASSFQSKLVTIYSNSLTDSVKHAAQRLLARVGGEQALQFIKENLKSPEDKTKIAAIGALGYWVDSSGFNLLMDYISTESNLKIRALAFDAAVKYASETKELPQEAWQKIANHAKIEEDQLKLINGIAAYSSDPWVFAILDNIIQTSDGDDAKDRAKRAIDYLEKMKKIQGEAQKKEAAK